MNLNIVLSSENSSLTTDLSSLRQALPQLPTRLYCLCANKPEANQVKNECEIIKNNKEIRSFTINTQDDFGSVCDLANHYFQNDASQGYILFLSSNVLLQKESLKQMIDCLASDDQAAGVNPILLADWISASEKRIAFMGLTFDCQKKLHYLYEGILVENLLVRKRRFFQIAHPGCLLVRCADFRKVGGFSTYLGFLTFPALCFQIGKFRLKGYACIPEARGYLRNCLDSWGFCGAWDSFLQRGRLDTSDIYADYADFCKDDGVEYGCDSWLAEGPAQMPDPSSATAVECWQQWRYHPKPTSLLSFISSLPGDIRHQGVDLARNRPASLPQTLQYYKAQAEKIKSLAEARDLSIAGQIVQWLGKIRRFHYGELKPGIELLKKAGVYNCSLDLCPAVFDAWVETSEKFTKLEISESWPEIAVVMPVWNPNPDFLRQAIQSVTMQTYPNWQLCIADDASTRSEIRPMLESFASGHERIKVKFREQNGHICRATNTALELVLAPFTAFLDHDDLLSPHALGEVAEQIAQKPDLGFIYTDDDRINEDNVRRNPMFKPDFDCDLFATGHLSTYATGVIRELGGLRIGTEGSQDQDLRLRATELLDDSRIAHIPRILYHWRVHEESTASSFLAKPYVLESARKVYLDAAARQGRKANWGERAPHRLFKLLLFPEKRCLCSVIFLIDDTVPSKALLNAVEDLKKYVDVELYVQPLRADSPRSKSCHSLPHVSDGIAHICNEAAAKVEGDVVLFLAGSLEPGSDCRLEQLVELAMTTHVAMASGNVWFRGRLASGGWYPDVDGLPFPLLQGMSWSDVQNSVWGQIFLPRHVLGAPWECMAVKKEFCKASKFLDEDYGSLAAVDFALRAMRQNKFVVMNPWVNWQAKAMPTPPTAAEMKFLLERRGAEIAACGLRNPNLRSAPDKDWTIIF